MKVGLLASARWTTSSRQIAFLTIGLLFVIWSMVIYWALNSRHQTVENRKAALVQTVAVVEEQNAQMLSMIRVALMSADQWVARHPDEDPGDSKEFIRLVEQLRESSGACKNFCVNGHLAGNCHAPRSDDGRSKESSTQGVAG